ncbi:hypothetical protein J8F10_03890 [Gemmata sp. G18]|uniref:Uncharacterized protein n=1 Tax=Gemmata palustris TaxID=2822762 RepID=A0ABS5BL53_9BACT|nr:hypothetical protein [Gemmata palustris]MBP3954431.1 hypothetical protein [Gemmata palustris]
MTTSPTTAMLARAEWPDPTLDARAVAWWPAGTFDELVARGLLAEVGPAGAAACDACAGDHVEPVRWVREPQLPPRACISCPEFGVVWLDPADLRRWVVRLRTLARLVTGALRASGEVVERVPGRVWKLGTVRASGRSWTGFLAVGLTRPDAAAVIESVPELRSPNALVFVPSAVPASSLWAPDPKPTVLALCDLLAPGTDPFALDRDTFTAALPPGERSKSKGPARTFVAPPGTTWDRVELLVGEHDVRVRAGATVERFGFAEAGFEDGRKRDVPDDVWAVLRVLARLGGALGTGDQITTKGNDLKQKVSTLRERLRALVGLDGDPFHRTPRGRPYRARFAIRSAGAATFPAPPGATWDDVTVTEVEPGILAIAVAVEARGAEYVRGEEDGDPGRWEGTTGARDHQIHYTLADLGLTGPGDTVEPAGEALLELVRGRGRLPRPAGDESLSALGDALARFFRFDGPPLTFDRKRHQWTARFEAASLVPPFDR